MPLWFLPHTPHKTPNIVGKPLQEALSILSKQNLNAHLIKELEDNIIPVGTVIHQNPSALQPVKADQTVSLIISKKPIPLTTPDLIGKKPQELSMTIKKSHASIEYITIPSAHKSPHCLAQTPLAGTPLCSKIIFSYVSSEKKSLCVMPNFTGISLAWVNEYLTSISIIFQAYTAEIPINDLSLYGDLNIIAQRPLAGSIIDLTKPPCIQLEVT